MITAQITGNATRDPELKTTQDGGQVARVSVAVKQKSIKQKDGSWADRKPWYVDAEVWGRDAMNAVDKIKKGDYLMLTGTLERDHWTSQQDGQERESFRLKKVQFEILQSSADRQVLKAARVSGQMQPDSPHQAANPNWNQAPASVNPDDIPF